MTADVNSSTDPAAPTPTTSSGKRLILFVLAGLVCGAVGQQLVEHSRHYFGLPTDLPVGEASFNPDPAISEAAQAATRTMNMKNAALAIGALGVLITGVFGSIPGLAARSFGRTTLGLCLGVVLGAILGTIAGLGGFHVYEYISTERVDWTKADGDPWLIYITMFTHATYWTGLCLALTLTLSAVWGGAAALWRLLAATLGVGVAWAMCYPFAAAILFPVDRSDGRIPEGTTNTLLWIGVYAVLLGLASGRCLSHAEAARARKAADAAA